MACPIGDPGEATPLRSSSERSVPQHPAFTITASQLSCCHTDPDLRAVLGAGSSLPCSLPKDVIPVLFWEASKLVVSILLFTYRSFQTSQESDVICNNLCAVHPTAALTLISGADGKSWTHMFCGVEGITLPGWS
jgi:hypothetical protein